jgi:cell division protein FtsL
MSGILWNFAVKEEIDRVCLLNSSLRTEKNTLLAQNRRLFVHAERKNKDISQLEEELRRLMLQKNSLQNKLKIQKQFTRHLTKENKDLSVAVQTSKCKQRIAETKLTGTLHNEEKQTNARKLLWKTQNRQIASLRIENNRLIRELNRKQTGK